jgi:PBSX family phage terminase large subunit
MVGEDRFYYRRGLGEVIICGRLCYVVGANDDRAFEKIAGATAAGAYCDEITLMPQSFWNMLLSRLSVEGAKLFGTTNTDSPGHWFYRRFVRRKKFLDMKRWNFNLDDNRANLPADYIDNLKREYVGLWYDRYILGRWVVAEGAIYTPYTKAPLKFIWQAKSSDPRELLLSLQSVSIGVDFGGTKSATAFVATGITKGYKEVIVLRSELRKGAVDDPESLNAAFVHFCREIKRDYPMAADVYCDSAETILIRGFRTALKRAGIAMNVRNAWKGEVKDRIFLVTSLMGQGRFFLLGSSTASLQRALRDAVWNPKRQSDERLDNGTTDIDSLDALEYSLEPIAKKLQEAGRIAT